MAKIFSGASVATQERALAVLGVGAQFSVALPFARTQESEANIIGIDLMARVGFNPRQSIQLWKRMDEAGGPRPSEFLSTHPSPQTRIEDLRKRMFTALPLNKKARLAGKNRAVRKAASL